MNREGITMNREGITMNREGIMMNREGIMMNREGIMMNREGITMDFSGSTMNFQALAICSLLCWQPQKLRSAGQHTHKSTRQLSRFLESGIAGRL